MQTQVEKECNATIKLILLQMEELGGLQPFEALDPYTFEERRRGIMRKIWSLVKLAQKQAGPTALYEV